MRISDWSSDVCSSDLMIPVRYILQPEVMRVLERQEKGAGGEIQLTDAMAQLIGRQPFHGFTFDGQRHDCGDKAGFIQANIALALARPDIPPSVRSFISRRHQRGSGLSGRFARPPPPPSK